MMTRVSGRNALICAASSIPFAAGRLMSISTTRGRRSATSFMPRAPSGASAIVRLVRLDCRKSRINARMTL
jgi:hypothetical protein